MVAKQESFSDKYNDQVITVYFSVKVYGILVSWRLQAFPMWNTRGEGVTVKFSQSIGVLTVCGLNPPTFRLTQRQN